MRKSLQALLSHRAAMHGYGSEDALRLLSPWYWLAHLGRHIRYSAWRLRERFFGHRHVLIKDYNDRGDTIAVLHHAANDEYTVVCEICFIMEIKYRTSSLHQARRIYDALRNEAWTIVAHYHSLEPGDADCCDAFIDALNDLAKRYQR